MTLGAWLLFGAAGLRAMVLSLAADVRSLPPVGDQASYMSQAMSLAWDRDLGFRWADQARLFAFYDEVWQTPLFIQRVGDDWAYAKVYGYPAWLALWISMLGPRWGAAVGNTVLLAAISSIVVVVLRRSYRGAIVPLVAAGVLFFSNLFLYAFTIHADLFIALLVAVGCWSVLKASDRAAAAGTRHRWAVASFAITGYLVVAKPPLVLALIPALALVLLRQVGRRRWLLPVVTLAVVLVAAVPYLSASGGGSWNAYEGDRYLTGTVCLPGEPGALAFPWETAHYFSTEFLVDGALTDPGMKARAAVGYLAGEHTGVLVFMPIAAVVVVLALVQAKRLTAEAWVMLAALALYVGFYVVWFPDNYYGGSQAIGNRYFVQISPVVAALAAAARLDARRLLVTTVGALGIGAVLLWPSLVDPRHAFWRLDRTTPVQRAVFVHEGPLLDYTFFLHEEDLDATTLRPIDPLPPCLEDIAARADR